MHISSLMHFYLDSYFIKLPRFIQHSLSKKVRFHCLTPIFSATPPWTLPRPIINLKLTELPKKKIHHHLPTKPYISSIISQILPFVTPMVPKHKKEQVLPSQLKVRYSYSVIVTPHPHSSLNSKQSIFVWSASSPTLNY